jgi:hypothetical protein
MFPYQGFPYQFEVFVELEFFLSFKFLVNLYPFPTKVNLENDGDL